MRENLPSYLNKVVVRCITTAFKVLVITLLGLEPVQDLWPCCKGSGYAQYSLRLNELITIDA